MGKHVRAAGGVVVHDGSVCLVHRPRYDDWSLPKGKLGKHEKAASAAIREVLEETGLECALGIELPSISYRDQRGRHKTVRYWLMSVAVDHGFAANDETDRIRWVALDEAGASMTYDEDRSVVAAAQAHVTQCS